MCFANFTREIPDEIHQKEGLLEMAKNWKCFEKFFTLKKFLDLGRLLVRIRPPKKSLYFSIRKVTHHNETLWVLTWAGHPGELGHPKNLCIFPPFHFSTWVSHPSQWNYIWKILVFFKKKKKKKSLSVFYHRACRLEQWDHLRNPFRVFFFFLSSRSPGKIRLLAKILRVSSSYQTGRLNVKFGNLKDQIEKWSFPVQNDTVSNMHCSSSSSSDAESPPAKKERKLWNTGIPVQLELKLQILSSWRLQSWRDKDEFLTPSCL